MSQAADETTTPRAEPHTLSKAYRPAETEPRVWRKWLDAGAFRADPQRVRSGEADPYAILIPPPNVTAALHLGHALNNTLQDVLARAHRMMGFETLWMPGTDHAGIATQTVVDKRLKAEGKPALADHKEMQRRGEPGRERFVEQVQAFKDEYEQRITEQLQAMGCSCDWDRQRFTMDPVCARAVREAFFRLFKDGLIYRGKRLVNWDPATQTALADDEVENVEVDGAFYYMRYPLVHPASDTDHDPVTWDELGARGYPGANQHPDDEQAWITVATTRPETYLGDTAVAVNPRDPRAESLRGLLCELPLVGRRIPIIEDDHVVLPVALGGDEHDAKAQMATGFLKVTPAHDPNDWEIGHRHADDIRERCSAGEVVINVMAPDATISADHGWLDFEQYGHNAGAEVFLGLSREDARQKVVEEFRARSLGEGSLLEKITPHRHSVGHSYRSHAAIEPYLSDQWYCKVTDDRLRGSAQRALNATQRSADSLASWPESSPSPTPPRGTGVPPVSSTSSRTIPDALTIHTRNLPHWQKGGHTYFVTFRLATGELTPDERRLVLDACFHFQGDRAITHIATVMPDHVHLILTPLTRDEGWWPLEELIHSIKSFTAHDIQKRRGSSGPLWQDEYFDRLVREDEIDETYRYVQNNPVESGLSVKPGDYPFTRRAEEQGEHGRDARATSTGSADAMPGDGRMTFHPPRYAKTYETWHDNLRDWCISRQLWWGHRIPVWVSPPDPDGALFEGDSRRAPFPLNETDITRQRFDDRHYLCFRNADKYADYIAQLEDAGWEQDPDVLDTWFSSALWPLSTMGWPDAAAAARDTGIADFPALLDAFNPTNVLCTAREIITLWVSRMVMFNRLFSEQDGSGPRLPYKDVFIHAMIQDGEGRKMSKSLGNGVDPLDIIHTHGADAMRFTLVQMTTQTQDVRMPVEPDPETGRNTSPKFDAGRNVCNKLWNAARFAIGMLADSPPEPGMPIDPQDLSLVDRWMLSRLAGATSAINTALKNYQFKDYADALYDLLWRDFCDWYLEAVKPTIQSDASQRAVLRLALDAILRLMHPVAPFITEAIFEQVRAIPAREIDGFAFAATKADGTLCQSGWPAPAASLRDEPAEDAFARVQALVSAIREVRAKNQVPPKRRVVLHATAELAKDVSRWSPLVETLAGVRAVEADAPQGPAAAFTFESAELHLSDLADAIDAGAERERLTKQLADLDKSVGALEGRLSNPGYVERAPEKLVNETRAQLERAKADRETVRAALERLG